VGESGETRRNALTPMTRFMRRQVIHRLTHVFAQYRRSKVVIANRLAHNSPARDISEEIFFGRTFCGLKE
jgi:hypothetical protein